MNRKFLYTTSGFMFSLLVSIPFYVLLGAFLFGEGRQFMFWIYLTLGIIIILPIIGLVVGYKTGKKGFVSKPIKIITIISWCLFVLIVGNYGVRAYIGYLHMVSGDYNDWVIENSRSRRAIWHPDSL